MSNRLFNLVLVVFLGGAGLALAQRRVPVEPRDLDSYPRERLLRDLEAELNDIEESMGADDVVSLDALEEALMEALSDDGDSGDPLESDINLEDLEEEMEEDSTSLEDVVGESLAEADRLSSREGSLSGILVQDKSSANSPSFRFHMVAFNPTAQNQGRQNRQAQVRLTRNITARNIANHVYRRNPRGG